MTTSKELVTIEFRYYDHPAQKGGSEYRTKVLTIGIFDTIEDAIEKGNEALKSLSNNFEVRFDDKFTLNGLFGRPKRLVTNTCYPTKGIQYFAKIKQLKFDDLSETIDEVFEAAKRYGSYLNSLNDD